MDAAASPNNDAEFDKVYDLFLKIENSAFPASIKQRHSVIKYTKLPDFDFDSKVTCHGETISLQPRLRRIVTINEPKLSSTRSLKPEIAFAPKTRTSSITKRKIVTIEEDNETDLHPKFSNEGRKATPKTSCRAVGTESKEDKIVSQRKTSRLSPYPKSLKDNKLSPSNNLHHNKKENDDAKLNYSSKHSSTDKFSAPRYLRSQKNREKEGVTRSSKSVYTTTKTNVPKDLGTASESDKDICLIKDKASKNWRNNNVTSKKIIEKQGINKNSHRENKSKVSYIKDVKNKNHNPLTIIHVPLDDKLKKTGKLAQGSESILNATLDKVNKVDCSTEVEKIIFSKDKSVGTEPFPGTIDQVTEVDTEYKRFCKCVENTNIHTGLKETFDSLDIPNVSLIKDKSSNLPKEDEINISSKSLPDLHISKEENKVKNETDDSRYSKSTSYIISRATLTYTTKQKINFQVVGKNENVPNDLSTSPQGYPLNVVSLYKNEVNNTHKNSEIKTDKDDKRNCDRTKNETNLKNMQQPNSPYTFNNSKLVKPSDIISAIDGHCGLLQSEYISEQFQRELKFIDSFFESLQYLEQSVAEKCISDRKVESWITKSAFDLKKLEYGSLLSTFDNETYVDDTETMASKSLCLLNLLIRDEQRRAKNLLFVLKMREDALKDFTKSQVLWLENKKKRSNTDISTLKKKQRGALLKLQHECGEMQRMRKALLTLSEKRKVALLKTKKNIELKLRKNIDVDPILSAKKKIKRTAVSDRTVAPIKCFDLSSSGCDESTTSWPRSLSVTPVPSPDIAAIVDTISSAEKSIQTGESVLVNSTLDQSTNTTDENFLAVDGGYLNILFQNLSLPQIFSNCKQYEVNEEALKNIVNTANNNRNNINESGDIQRLMDEIKNYEADQSTSPFTTHSNLDEFDNYCMELVDGEDRTPSDSENPQSPHTPVICEVRDTVIQSVESRSDQCLRAEAESQMGDENLDKDCMMADDTFVSHEPYECEPSPTVAAVEASSDMVTASVAGPLPVPAGAAATPDSQMPDALSLLSQATTSSSDLSSSSCLTMSSVASPVHHEAEELRRQQLAIEREIKALEEQQCQMLVVREIPDKPPPPYTPPVDPRVPKTPRMFLLDEATEQKIRTYISMSCTNMFDPGDQFEVFIKDFCQETLDSEKPEKSDKPWHSCNLLPQKPPEDAEKIVASTTSHIAEVFKGVTPTVVSGVGARRSDHIDDILFAEWRRCEPEWTTLHSDEATVKNQLFESIFQRILTETVDEYKKNVLCVPDDESMDI